MAKNTAFSEVKICLRQAITHIIGSLYNRETIDTINPVTSGPRLVNIPRCCISSSGNASPDESNVDN